MPGPWKSAKFSAVALVYFLDGAGDMIGYGISEGGEEGMPLNITLDNGSYNGTVALPIRETAGALSGKTCSVTMVFAKLGRSTHVYRRLQGRHRPQLRAMRKSGFFRDQTRHDYAQLTIEGRISLRIANSNGSVPWTLSAI